MKSRGASNQDGFSLLEVLVAMMVLSIGAASVLSLFAAAAGTHKRSIDRTHAALVAEQLLSEVRARYVVGTSAENLRKKMIEEVPEFFGDYRWKLELTRPGIRKNSSKTRGGVSRRPKTEATGSNGDWKPQELVARIEIRWKRSGSNRSDSFYTILLPRNSTGAAGGTARSKSRTRAGRLIGR